MRFKIGAKTSLLFYRRQPASGDAGKHSADGGAPRGGFAIHPAYSLLEIQWRPKTFLRNFHDISVLYFLTDLCASHIISLSYFSLLTQLSIPQLFSVRRKKHYDIYCYWFHHHPLNRRIGYLDRQ
jgi:hypothetical protein